MSPEEKKAEIKEMEANMNERQKEAMLNFLAGMMANEQMHASMEAGKAKQEESA